jgi:hypothetical protein
MFEAGVAGDVSPIAESAVDKVVQLRCDHKRTPNRIRRAIAMRKSRVEITKTSQGDKTG